MPRSIAWTPPPPAPPDRCPLRPKCCCARPSGDLFGWSQNAGMGWDPAALGGKEFLILSTHGGIRAADGTPIALGLSHRPLGSRPADGGRGRANSTRRAPSRSPPIAPTPATAARRAPPACSIACPTATMRPSIFRRLIRSLPTRRGVLGVATCDKGLPAMMMALAGTRDLPVRPGARRRHAAGRGGRRRRARSNPSARASPAGRSRWKRPPKCAAAPAPRPAAAASSWARRPPRRWSARRSACRCRIRRSRLRASPSGSTWPAARPRALLALRGARLAMRDILTRRRGAQRHGGARGLRRLDEPAAAPARHRPRRRPARGPRSTTGRASTARCRAWSTRCPTARWAIPRCRCSWPAACRR